MEEIKNLFIKGRMNKDVDDRIVPGGEYREARNVIITNSEGSDAGAVQRMKGFTEVADFGPDFVTIHMLPDNSRNLLYIWLAPSGNKKISKIVAVSESGSVVTLVEGEFLNFPNESATVHANILEEYLFWVDGLNQPRVIDIVKALEGAQNSVPYYTEEHHISVAKYNPYKVARAITINEYKDSSSVDNVTIDINQDSSFVKPGDFIINVTPGKNKIIGIATSSAGFEITLDRDITGSFSDNDIISIVSSTMTDQSDNAEWKGDPDLLEDKFVRFSYRYKYDDNTLSLIAPYTQVMYIPKQRGYFLDGDEERAYKSTVVKFMENSINNIDLFIPLPSNQPEADYHIKEIEIIYTESDSISAQVVDTIPVNDAFNEIIDSPGLDGVHFKYTYKSKLPYKTVTQQDYIRVSDQVPTIARAQSVAGNRVMYGNYDTKLAAPETINFGLTSGNKLAQNMLAAEYPTHTVKQNRQYQAGIVLKDKFGRSSGVITSGFFNDVNNAIPSSTFHAFKPETTESIAQWLGDALRVVIYDAIESDNLYAEKANTVVVSSNSDIEITDNNIKVNATNPWQVGEYLRGEHIDYVEIISIQQAIGGNIYVCDGHVSTEYYKYNPGLGADQGFSSYNINPVGWYSFNVVIKQTEHDYYNAYLPGILDGTLSLNSTKNGFDNVDTGKLGTIVLYSDNINKIPRDLSEVGPDQEQYRSSGVRLHGRVENANGFTKQVYPGRIDNEVTRIGTFRELFTNVEDTTGSIDVSAFEDLEGIKSNPLIAIIENTQGFGNTLLDIPENNDDAYQTDLAVFEAEPVQSRLDIYWETSTSGLISDLNTLINNSSDGPVSIDEVFTNYDESIDFASGAPVSSAGTKVYNGQGAEIKGYTATIVSVKNKSDVVLSSHPFTISIDNSDPIADLFFLQSNENFEYVKTSNLLDSYTITVRIENSEGYILKDFEVDAINSGVAGSLFNGSSIAANFGNHSESFVIDVNNTSEPKMLETTLDNGSAADTKYAETALSVSNVEYEENNLYIFPTEGYSGTFNVVSGELPFIQSYAVLRNTSGSLDDDPGNSTGTNLSKKWEVTLTTVGMNQTTENYTLNYSVVDINGDVKYSGARVVLAGNEMNETIIVWDTVPTQETFFDNYFLHTTITVASADESLEYTLNNESQLYIATLSGSNWVWTTDPGDSSNYQIEDDLHTTDTPVFERASVPDNYLEIVSELNGNEKKNHVKFSNSAKPRKRQTWYFDWALSDCDGAQGIADTETGTNTVELT